MEEVLRAAKRKFRERVSNMMRTKSHFNLGTRVEMANTYLIPIFGYLMRFYIMDEATRTRVTELLGDWCKGKAMGTAKLMAPSADAGLAQPLIDVRYLNLAIMLRGCVGREQGCDNPMHMGTPEESSRAFS